jgi:hypothetical protein
VLPFQRLCTVSRRDAETAAAEVARRTAAQYNSAVVRRQAAALAAIETDVLAAATLTSDEEPLLDDADFARWSAATDAAQFDDTTQYDVTPQQFDDTHQFDDAPQGELLLSDDSANDEDFAELFLLANESTDSGVSPTSVAEVEVEKKPVEKSTLSVAELLQRANGDDGWGSYYYDDSSHSYSSSSSSSADNSYYEADSSDSRSYSNSSSGSEHSVSAVMVAQQPVHLGDGFVLTEGYFDDVLSFMGGDNYETVQAV